MKGAKEMSISGKQRPRRPKKKKGETSISVWVCPGVLQLSVVVPMKPGDWTRLSEYVALVLKPAEKVQP